MRIACQSTVPCMTNCASPLGPKASQGQFLSQVFHLRACIQTAEKEFFCRDLEEVCGSVLDLGVLDLFFQDELRICIPERLLGMVTANRFKSNIPAASSQSLDG